MSTTASALIDASALDLSGITVSTSSPDVAIPRAGTAYDPVTLAAAQPIWFHPLHDGSLLMLNARRWYGATPAGGAGFYSAYSEDITASWFVVDGPSGHRRTVPGFSISVPRNTTVNSARLVGAASRAPFYLYLLHAATIGPDNVALLQRLQVNLAGSVTIAAEEVLPTAVVGADTIVFNKGVQYDNPNLVCYGTDSTGAIYAIAKLYSQVGTTRDRGVWGYFTGTGYSTDPTLIAPIAGPTTVGPVSFATAKTLTLMATVAKTGANYFGNLWASRSGRPWTQLIAAIPLGSDTGTTYLGGTVQLQPLLQANPAAAAMTPDVATAIVYLTTVKASVGGNTALTNVWGLHPISR